MADNNQKPEQQLVVENQIDESKLLEDAKVEANADEKSSKASRAAFIKRRKTQRESRKLNYANLSEREQVIKNISLANAIKRQEIFNGTLASVETHSINGASEVFGVVFLKDYDYLKVLIPYDEMYLDTMIDESTVDLTTAGGREKYTVRKENLIASSIGAPISFVIEYIYGELGVVSDDYSGEDAKELVGCAIGSRAQAMELQQKIYFTGEGARYKAGQIVSSTIIAIGNNRLCVTVGGVDLPILRRFLPDRYTTDLRMLYQLGDKLDILINSFEKDEFGYVTGMVINARIPVLEKQKKLLKVRTPVNSKHVVTLVRVYNMSDYRANMYVYSKETDMIGKLVINDTRAFGREIHIGDNVRAKVISHDAHGYPVFVYQDYIGPSTFPN